MDLILIPKNSLFYCHSNDKKSLKNLFFKKKNCSNQYNCYKNKQIKLMCNWLNKTKYSVKTHHQYIVHVYYFKGHKKSLV